MEELRLVGYTADLRHLVVRRVDDDLQFKVPVDSALIETIHEIAGKSDDGDGVVAAMEGLRLEEVDGSDEPGASGLAGLAIAARSQADAAGSAASGASAATAAAPAHSPKAEPDSLLPPREIQARLRAGKPVRSVAKAAGISTERVERWLGAIEGEREQVLAAWRAARITRSRLGPSHDVLGDAVRRNLAAKRIDPDEVTWRVTRAEGDPHWTIELRYTSRGRSQRARYRLYPDVGSVEAVNELAETLGWTRAAPVGGAAAPPRAPSAAAAKKATATKKSSAKKGAAKKAAASKKSAAKKGAAKKAAASKKSAAKKGAAKKAAASKKATATKKSAAKKGAAKKATASKKTTSRRAPRR